MLCVNWEKPLALFILGGRGRVEGGGGWGWGGIVSQYIVFNLFCIYSYLEKCQEIGFLTWKLKFYQSNEITIYLINFDHYMNISKKRYEKKLSITGCDVIHSTFSGKKTLHFDVQYPADCLILQAKVYFLPIVKSNNNFCRVMSIFFINCK